MAARSRQRESKLRGPFLRRVTIQPERVEPGRYPFNIRAFSRGIDLKLEHNVTFFVGENGSGKSTLLEAIAAAAGVNPHGAAWNTDRGTIPTVPSWHRRFAWPASPKRRRASSCAPRASTRFGRGIYILDEPEAALSYSSIILAYPGARLLSLDGDGIQPVAYMETDHYRLTRDFLNAPERYFRHLFAPEDTPDAER